jgi:hypothetical protein
METLLKENSNNKSWNAIKPQYYVRIDGAIATLENETLKIQSKSLVFLDKATASSPP